jgi:hypothetical protein
MPLAEMQREFAHAILAGEAVPGIVFAEGPVAAIAALQQHRNTVMGALVNALRLTFPSVDRLVGENFFDQAACAFAEAYPPADARLAHYGDGFPAFLESYAPASQLAYLADVARLDLAIDRVLLASQARHTFALEEAVSLELPLHLYLLTLNYPADLIRDALGDDVALAAIDLRPAPRRLVVWRTGRRAMVRNIHAAATRFLEDFLTGAAAETAFAAAIGDAPQETAMQAIQSDIFAASFCNVISNRE